MPTLQSSSRAFSNKWIRDKVNAVVGAEKAFSHANLVQLAIRTECKYDTVSLITFFSWKLI